MGTSGAGGVEGEGAPRVATREITTKAPLRSKREGDVQCLRPILDAKVTPTARIIEKTIASRLPRHPVPVEGS